MEGSIDSRDFDYQNILSDSSAYGIIWHAVERSTQQVCVIKMVVLNKGLHYDHKKHKYYLGSKHVSTAQGEEFFFHQKGSWPFVYEKLKGRKAMNVKSFLREARMTEKLGARDAAPRVFHYWIEQHKQMYLGFIAMEKIPQSLKDVLLQRPLEKSEMTVIKNLIHRLHLRLKLAHGDLKPSNIGVFLKNQEIVKACFLDLQRVKTVNYHLKTRDWQNFKLAWQRNEHDR